MSDLLVPGVLIAIVALAIRWDLLEHRIPNALCGPALLAGVTLNALSDGVPGLWLAISGALAGLAVFLPLYLLKGMGAGDVKLMAAVGSFVGPLDAAWAAAMTLALGALIALGIVVRRRFLSRPARLEAVLADNTSLTPTPAASLRKERFPYAVAIAGGTILCMWYQGQLDPLAAALLR